MLSRVVIFLSLGAALTASFFWGSAVSHTSQRATEQACNLHATDATHQGMLWVAGGDFTMGAEYAYREEGPAHRQYVSGFWMDQTEVTNAQFAEFVAATSYLTLAERGIENPFAPEEEGLKGSAVFKPITSADPLNSWWQFVEGANWQHPQGPASNIAGKEHHPVVHIAYEDALAYAQWKGHSLPTEAQFEFAAQTSSRKNSAGEHISNTWQGFFPFENDPVDGYLGTAPVGCYTANALGLFDLIGNVWEWTASPFYMGHDFAGKSEYPEGFDPQQPDERSVAVIKGGSYLCAANYCMRYRPEARQGQSKGLGTSHIGFRTVLNVAN